MVLTIDAAKALVTGQYLAFLESEYGMSKTYKTLSPSRPAKPNLIFVAI
jgi:hypothetical protein